MLLKVNKIIAAVILVCSFQGMKAQTMADVWKAVYNDQPEKAKTLLKAMVTANPNDMELNYRMGNIYFQSGKKDSAAIYYNQGLKAQEKGNYCMAGIMQLALDAKNTEKATENFNNLTGKGKSKDAKAYLFAGEAYYSGGKDLDNAIVNIKRASELDPKNVEIYMEAGPVYLAKGDGGKAVSAYELAIEKDPKLAVAYNRIGQIYMMSRNYEEAFKHFQLANQLDPDFIPVYHELAEFYYYAKKYADAVTYQKKYVDMAGPNVERLSRYADFLFLSKDYPNTITIIENIVKQDSSNVILSRLIGYSYYEQGKTLEDQKNIDSSKRKYQDAVTYLQKFFAKIAANKIISSDYAYYGKALAKVPGNDSLALVYLNKAITLDTANADLYNDLATVLMAQSKFVEAAKAYQKKMDVSRPNSGDYMKIVNAEMKANDWVHADSALAKYSELQPESVMGYYYRAQVNTRMDTTSENGLALPYYQKFIDLATDTAKYKKRLIEAYSYIAYYDVLKDKVEAAKEAMKKVLELDPADQQAIEFFKNIEQAKKAKAPKPKQ